MDIVFKDRNLYVGVTKKGVQVEMRINQVTKEIETAYITFKNFN